MHYLVKYEDDVLQVVPRVVKAKSYIKAKYHDGYYYNVEILANNASRKLLEQILKNLQEGLPRVVLKNEKLDFGTLSSRSEREGICYQHHNATNMNNKNEENNTILSNVCLQSLPESDLQGGICYQHCNATNLNNKKQESVIKILSDVCLQSLPECDLQGDEIVQRKSTSEKKSTHKKHCCYYCKKIVFQIVRHWTNIHHGEEEVKAIMQLHSENAVRKTKIDRLRRKGDYEFNKRQSDSKNYIVTRIPYLKETVTVPCPSCFGYFSKNNLRHHKQRCSPNKRSRQLQGDSRKITNHIHEKASNILRDVITPNMFHDEVTNQVIFDEILIIYGNYLCIKYTENHLKNHIRAQLRLLGRFMIQVKKHDANIKDCKQLIHSKHIDTVRKAVDDIAELDNSTNIYKHPTNARTLLTELKKIVQVVKSESDKNEDGKLMERAKGFNRRIKQELAPYINRVCKHSENKIKRQNQIKSHQLPKNEEIGKYLDKLYNIIMLNQKELEKKFSPIVWTKLTQSLMVYLAAFNRKRPGETQRLEVLDFYNREHVKTADVTYLGKSEKLQANKYERISFRGKLGNTTALLIDKIKILPGLELMLKYRQEAQVHPENIFLFAKPSKELKHATFDAYRCHRDFCEMFGIDNQILTFTKLRKQFATEVAKRGVSQEDEKRCSTYMSHDFKIHKNIYDHSATVTDITKVSKHLESCVKSRNEIPSTSSSHKHFNKISYESGSDEQTPVKKKKFNCNKTGKNIRCSDDPSFTSTDYSPSTDEPSLEEVEECIGKYRKRKLWSSLEKQTTRDSFREEIFNNQKIDNEKIRNFKKHNKIIMSQRTIPMIKQWIQGEKLKIERRSQGLEGLRPRFSTPERELLESSVERHSTEQSEPSMEEFEDLIMKYDDIFKNRTPESLFRKFQNIKDRKRI